ncbi:hypothetical protein SRB5_17180 [Streptomyces sp. RB5]|uniref:SCP2 domain-containing protein n=1 Tax=Streptomyces smaragdinus TaxID=2585196 RepID=A0A7K0CDQ0_9ACTN|nr:SCP2 sterol-binding domain-containing protein [Streptomyces smaragdinus]MQY11599.1 hypothetical protein [Streptomyces smaragdinus]
MTTHDRADVAGPIAAVRAELLSSDDVDERLDLVFSLFRASFRADRTHGRSGVFQFEIDTPAGVRYRCVSVADGHCTASDVAPAPNAVIAVDLADLVALSVGGLKGTDAFLGGRLKISGDVVFAMNWIEWFGARSRI